MNNSETMSDLNLQPTLAGNNVTLRPLRSDDFAGVYAAASNPVIWEQHPDSTRYQREVFQERFFSSAIAIGGALAVVENRTSRIIGSSRYYEWDREKREISIGYTFLERTNWGTGTNQEMKRLMLAHAFKQVRVVS